MKRRTFLQNTALAAAVASVPLQLRRGRASSMGRPAVDTQWLQDAVASAMKGGATYAEALLRSQRSESIQLRKEEIAAIDSETAAGITLRVYSGGAWGSASVSSWEPGRPDVLAGVALASAKQLATLRTQEFDPDARQDGGTYQWRTPMETDPFDVAIEDKLAFLHELTNTPLRISQIPFAVANLFLRRTDSTLVTSRNAEIRQSMVFTYLNFAVTAFHQKLRRMDTRTGSLEAQAAGWEIADGSMRSDLETAMQEVLQLQTADPVTQDSYDIVMHPTLLWDLLYDTLLPHLDTRRIQGMDGGNPVDRWLRPEQIGSTRIGSEFLNLHADSSLPRGLASCGWDDTGRPGFSTPLVEGGRILRLPTDETLPALPGVQGLGFSRSPQWNIPASMAMPNIVLQESDGGSLFDMISGVDSGLFMKGRGNVIMNPAKTMFRVRPQIAWIIRSGKLAEPVRGVEIETSVEQFWNSLAVLSGAEESMVGGDLFPGRTHALWEVPFSVSVPAGLFRRIPVYAAQEAR